MKRIAINVETYGGNSIQFFQRQSMIADERYLPGSIRLRARVARSGGNDCKIAKCSFGTDTCRFLV
jgi:hypothetical protein